MATMANGEILWSPRINVIQSEDEVRCNLQQLVYNNGDAAPLS